MLSFFELALLGLLVCITFPFALLGVASSDRARLWHEGRMLLVSAGTAMCVALAWLAVLID